MARIKYLVKETAKIFVSFICIRLESDVKASYRSI